MKYFVLLIGLFFANGLFAQAPSRVPEPQYIAVDSKDNVYVAVKYGIIRIQSKTYRPRLPSSSLIQDDVAR